MIIFILTSIIITIAIKFWIDYNNQNKRLKSQGGVEQKYRELTILIKSISDNFLAEGRNNNPILINIIDGFIIKISIDFTYQTSFNQTQDEFILKETFGLLKINWQSNERSKINLFNS